MQGIRLCSGLDCTSTRVMLHNIICGICYTSTLELAAPVCIDSAYTALLPAWMRLSLDGFALGASGAAIILAPRI